MSVPRSRARSSQNALPPEDGWRKDRPKRRNINMKEVGGNRPNNALNGFILISIQNCSFNLVQLFWMCCIIQLILINITTSCIIFKHAVNMNQVVIDSTKLYFTCKEVKRDTSSPHGAYLSFEDWLWLTLSRWWRRRGYEEKVQMLCVYLKIFTFVIL